MSDLPALWDALRENPADESRWLALFRHLWAEGRDDEAVAVRVFWPTLQDNFASGASPGMTLGDLATFAGRSGRRAREIEGRGARE
jgi:hypothetical protein